MYALCFLVIANHIINVQVLGFKIKVVENIDDFDFEGIKKKQIMG